MLASLDAFELSTLYLYFTIGDNMTFCYVISGTCLILITIFLLPFFKLGHNKLNKKSFCSVLTSVDMGSYPLKANLMIICYFLSIGSNILVSIYGTSWVSISIMEGKPIAEKFTYERRLFD